MQKTRNAKTQRREGAEVLETFRDGGSGVSAASRACNLIRRGKVIFPGLLLFGLVVWVFLPALRGDFIEFDDSVYVTRNTHVNTGLTWGNLTWGISHTVVGNWHPLAVWSHMLDCQLYGLKPWGHHLTSILLHALNAVLVFLVMRQITGATWRSLLVAGLFGLHPLRVESVAWICERKDVLSLMFWLLTISAYAKYAVASKARSPTSKEWYGLTLVMFICGLMSKPMVVTLPCVLLLLDYWPLRRFELSTHNTQLSTALRMVVEKAPFFILSAFTCAVAYLSGRANGAMSFLPNLTLGARLGNALISYGRYLGKLFWPVNLCAHYLHPGYWPIGKVLLAVVLLSGISGLAFALRRQRPYLLAGWLWYLGTLVPVIGLVQAGSQSMADRFTYIPCLGLLIALVWGMYELTRQWRHQGTSLCAAGGVAVLSCIALTHEQIGHWKDGVNVWTRAVAVRGDNYDARVRLGRALVEQGHADEAIRELQEAVRLNPGSADGYCNLGGAMAAKGRIDEAIGCFRKALEIRPDYGVAHNNLGFILSQQGQLDEALAHFQAVLKMETANEHALANVGSVLLRLGRADEAITEYQKALDLKPDFTVARINLGYALVEKGNVDEAITEFRKAQSLRPDDREISNILTRLLDRKQSSTRTPAAEAKP